MPKALISAGFLALGVLFSASVSAGSVLDRVNNSVVIQTEYGKRTLYLPQTPDIYPESTKKRTFSPQCSTGRGTFLPKEECIYMLKYGYRGKIQKR